MGLDHVPPVDPIAADRSAALDRYGAAALLVLFGSIVFSLYGVFLGMLLLWTSATWNFMEKNLATAVAAVCVVSPFALLPFLAPTLGDAGILALLPWDFAGPLTAIYLVVARYRRRA